MILRAHTTLLFCIILASYPPKSVQQASNSQDAQYVGCFADDFDRILRDYRCMQNFSMSAICPGCAGAGADDAAGFGRACQNPTQMTVDLCKSICRTGGHVFAGLEAKSECYCGNAGSIFQKLMQDEMKCNEACPGNGGQICGGEFYISVFDLNIACTVPTLNPSLLQSESSALISIGGTLTSGQQLAFECQNGYTLSGSPTITCQDNGSFSPALPTCIAPATLSPVTCKDITAPSDGSISPNQEIFRAGQFARIDCNLGFQVNGARIVTCGGDGEWTPTPNATTCQKAFCDVPPEVPNAEWVLNTLGRSVGGSVIYTCLTGFTAELHATGRICSKDFEWLGPAPVCAKEFDPNSPPDNVPLDDPGGVPALVWIFIIIVIICVIIFIAGCFVTRTGDPGDYKRPDPYINDGVVVARDGEKYPSNDTAPLFGPAVATISNETDFGVPAENYSSRATSIASGTLRGLSANEADRYIDSLFDMDGMDDTKDSSFMDEYVGPYDSTLDPYGPPPVLEKELSPYHHPEPSPYHDPEPIENYPSPPPSPPPPPPPEEPQYHDLDRDRMRTPSPPPVEMELPAHSGPTGSVSRNSMYLPPEGDYPSVTDPVNTRVSNPSSTDGLTDANQDKEFLDEVDDFFDGVNNKIDNCMMQ